jgi:hypothetical protein
LYLCNYYFLLSRYGRREYNRQSRRYVP